MEMHVLYDIINNDTDVTHNLRQTVGNMHTCELINHKVRQYL